MSGDYGPHITLPAVVQFLQDYPNAHAIAVGDQALINQILATKPARLSVVHASDVIGMDDKPAAALRSGQDSSLFLAIKEVAEQRAQACVSAGNTGAMMAIGRYLLGTLAGIDRPAIATALPTQRGVTTLLDLGANTDCSANNLLQFALMGSVLIEAAADRSAPTVALLNIGKEAIKGNELVKEADALLEKDPYLNYIGFVEGDDIYGGAADVVICDGFVGNIALKTSEGLARLVATTLDHTFRNSLYGKLVGWMAKPVLNEVKRVLDPSRRNGASLLGLQGTVVKSHGGAGQMGFYCAIEQAYNEARQDIPCRLNSRLAALSDQD